MDYSTKEHRAIHIPSNGAITLDLSLLKRLHPGLSLTDFHAIVGNSAPPSNVSNARADVFVLIDGKQRFVRQGLTFAGGPDLIDFPLAPKDRFITLATTDGGDGNERDWILFADPRFDCHAQ